MGDAGWPDADFLRRFEDCTIPDAEFDHRAHLRMTWLFLTRLGSGEAAARVTAGIQRFAAAHGASHIYNETLTLVWVRLVGAALRQTPPPAGFERFLASQPQLLSKELPFRHYRRETLMSDVARREWVEPDLEPLP